MAFDRDDSTSWQSSAHSDSTTSFEIKIDLPSKILINPTSIFVRTQHEGSSSTTEKHAKIMGYNPLIDNWEELGKIVGHASATNTTVTITNNVFYSKFKFVMYRYTSMKKYNLVYEFQITSGTLRKEN